jgi:N-acetylneuraminic acid mutarotase
LIDGKVLVTGGFNDSTTLKSVELYDPSTGKWIHTNHLRNARFLHAASVLPNGKVLAFAGVNDDEFMDALDSAELYDPSTGNWTRTSHLKCPRFSFAATPLLNGKVLATGGMVDDDGGVTYSAELYDPSTGNWTFTGDLKLPRNEHTASLLKDGRVLVTGGFSEYCEKTTELYDPSMEIRTDMGDMKYERLSLKKSRLRNKKWLPGGSRRNHPKQH